MSKRHSILATLIATVALTGIVTGCDKKEEAKKPEVTNAVSTTTTTVVTASAPAVAVSSAPASSMVATVTKTSATTTTTVDKTALIPEKQKY